MVDTLLEVTMKAAGNHGEMISYRLERYSGGAGPP